MTEQNQRIDLPHRKRSKKNRILVIEDDLDLVSVLSERLKKEGYQVSSNRDGIAAIDQINREVPDLVLMNINTAKSEGHNIGLLLRVSIPCLPIIVMTDSDGIATKLKSKLYDAEDVITKPFDMEKLVEKINSLLHFVLILAVTFGSCI